MTGMGNLSLIVSLLSAWKSRHMHQVPSFLSTMTIGEEYGLVMGWITPTSSNS
jgi:hypothetical protein